MQLDLDNDDAFGGTGEYNDTRTHNLANELTGQNTNNTGPDEYNPTFSGNGEMTSDDNEYEYTWDAWGRLVSIDSIIAETNVSTMRYNGLGWMKSFTEPAGGGGSTTYWNTHDHKGRTLLTRRGTDVVGDDDAAYKQRYVYHNAGRAGSGSSSYRNAMILRDGDLTNGWSGAADGTYELRHYMLQNHRGDVVAMVRDTGTQAGHIRYDAYGMPTTLPAGDTDSDGDFDSSDVFTGSYDVRKDVNLDGNNNVFDAIAASAEYGGYVTLGRGTLGHDATQHLRIGWQGSEHNSATPARLVHTPARVHHVILGRWLSRDPAGSVDGPNLYQYARSGAIEMNDWSGNASADPFIPASCQALYDQLIASAHQEMVDCIHSSLGDDILAVLSCPVLCLPAWSAGPLIYAACVIFCEALVNWIAVSTWHCVAAYHQAISDAQIMYCTCLASSSGAMCYFE